MTFVFASIGLYARVRQILRGSHCLIFDCYGNALCMPFISVEAILAYAKCAVFFLAPAEMLVAVSTNIRKSFSDDDNNIVKIGL